MTLAASSAPVVSHDYDLQSQSTIGERPFCQRSFTSFRMTSLRVILSGAKNLYSCHALARNSENDPLPDDLVSAAEIVAAQVDIGGGAHLDPVQGFNCRP